MPRDNLSSRDFWTNFAASYWEKRPRVLRSGLSGPLLTPGETFQALIGASDHYRAGSGTSIDFYIEYAKLIADVGAHLPDSNDRSLEEYAARISRQIGRRRFGLVVEDIHIYHPTLWLKLRDFLRPLYEMIGIPGDSATSSIFLGNYEKTPFGLHVGDAGTFKFVLQGRKRMRVWPGECFSGKKHLAFTRNYEQFLKGSSVLEGEPGNLLYWPSSYWHIGESIAGDVVMSLSVPIFFAGRPSSDLEPIEKWMDQKLSASNHGNLYPLATRALQKSVSKLTASTGRMARTLGEASRDVEILRTLQVRSLNRITAFGFNRVPPPLPPEPLEDHENVSSNSNYPLLWIEAGDELICSASGHSFSITAHPKILRLLRLLNEGRVSLIKDLIAKYSGVAFKNGIKFDCSPEDIRSLLIKLRCLRFLSVLKD